MQTADRLEANFMARMPPSRRLQKYKPDSSPSVMEGSATDEENVTETTHLLQNAIPKFGKNTAKKLTEGELVFEDGKLYDMSLAKAVAKTCMWSWLFAVCIQVFGGPSSSTLFGMQLTRQKFLGSWPLYSLNRS